MSIIFSCHHALERNSMCKCILDGMVLIDALSGINTAIGNRCICMAPKSMYDMLYYDIYPYKPIPGTHPCCFPHP